MGEPRIGDRGDGGGRQRKLPLDELANEILAIGLQIFDGRFAVHAREQQHEANIMTEFASQRPSLQEQILLHELNHRVNNEFATAISIVSLAASASGNDKVKDALSRVGDLLHRFADVHRALQMPGADRPIDAAAYLRELCQAISRARLRHRSIELLLIENPLQLGSVQCWRLGLIVAELITNASRHAFAGGGGTIRIELKRCGSQAECRVSDNGSGHEDIRQDTREANSEAIRQGQGLAIIRDLATGLDGKVEQHFGADGAVAVVSFPILNI